MSPLSPQKRTLYFTFFAVVFVLLIPLIVLYANGYRFTSDLTLTRRGGIYVEVSHSNARITVDGIPLMTTSYFDRSHFMQDMGSGTHSVTVTHPKRHAWYKEIVVEPQKVTPVHPFLLPTTFTLLPVESPAATTTAATSSEPTRSRYREIASYFRRPATTTVSQPEAARIPVVRDTATITPATATPEVIPSMHKVTSNDVTLWHTWRAVYAHRTSDDGWLPRRFCNPFTCSNPMEVVATDGRVTHIDFYPGRDDVILYTQPDGLYVAEIDKRPRQINERIIAGSVDFRVRHGVLYIKRGDQIAEVRVE